MDYDVTKPSSYEVKTDLEEISDLPKTDLEEISNLPYKVGHAVKVSSGIAFIVFLSLFVVSIILYFRSKNKGGKTKLWKGLFISSLVALLVLIIVLSVFIYANNLWLYMWD